MAADVYTAEHHLGRGGWTWYTGSASWMYRVALEAILGFHKEGDSLTLDPRIPKAWDGFTIEYRHGETVYAISVKNPAHVTRGVRAVRVNGAAVEDGRIRSRMTGGGGKWKWRWETRGDSAERTPESSRAESRDFASAALEQRGGRSRESGSPTPLGMTPGPAGAPFRPFALPPFRPSAYLQFSTHTTRAPATAPGSWRGARNTNRPSAVTSNDW